MKKLLLKCALYTFLLLLALEGWVRLLHLSKDSPVRFVDEKKVEKWYPNQNGHAVTGNRRQNFSEYRINKSGFNSYREFTPSQDKIEVALVGDSFIEGFHQHYYNSIGKKIENKLPGIEVYEYGYAGYDFADQIHLVHAYKEQFELIDVVIFGLKFSNDLTRGEYNIIPDRLKFNKPPYKWLTYSKLLVYAQNIGAFDAPKRLISNMFSMLKPARKAVKNNVKEAELERQYIANFESLIETYGFNKDKYVFLLDSGITSPQFIEYLIRNNYKYIDIGPALERASKPTTLIYDKHWNNYGRTIVASEITKYLRQYNLK